MREEVIVNDAIGLGNKRGEPRLEKKTKSDQEVVVGVSLMYFALNTFFFI